LGHGGALRGGASRHLAVASDARAARVPGRSALITDAVATNNPPFDMDAAPGVSCHAKATRSCLSRRHQCATPPRAGAQSSFLSPHLLWNALVSKSSLEQPACRHDALATRPQPVGSIGRSGINPPSGDVVIHCRTTGACSCSEKIRGQLRVAHGRGYRAVAQVVLDRSRILAVVGQLVPAAVARHLAGDQERGAGGGSSQCRRSVLIPTALVEPDCGLKMQFESNAVRACARCG
jgi:hypothetical protein